MDATLISHSYPIMKKTKLSYGDLLNIKIALKASSKSYRKVDMNEEADDITNTLRKVSAVMARQSLKQKKKR